TFSIGRLTNARWWPPSGSRYTPSTAPPSLFTRSSTGPSSAGTSLTASSVASSSVGVSLTPRRFLVPAFFATFFEAFFLAAIARQNTESPPRAHVCCDECSRECPFAAPARGTARAAPQRRARSGQRLALEGLPDDVGD